MKWEDLEPGDKVKISKNFEKISMSWAYTYLEGILEVCSVVIYEHQQLIEVYHRPLYRPDLRPLYIRIDKNGCHYGYNREGLGPVFEIVELKE